MYRLISFIIIFPAGIGLRLQTTATAGNPMWQRMTLTGVLMLMATGPTPMRVGHGFLTKISGGQLTTMAVGLAWLIPAGFGSLAAISIGARPGSRGELVATMSAGRLCLRAVPELFMRDSPLAVKWTSNSILVRPITTLSTFVLSVSRSCATEFTHRRKMLTISTTR